MNKQTINVFLSSFFITFILLSIGYFIGDYRRSNATLTLYSEAELKTPVSYEYIAEFSAYTLSEDETDGDPCIGARNLNLCKLETILKGEGLYICASRDLPLDTLIYIEGIGDCVVLDRMNIRYKGTGNIDILMDNKINADIFGRKQLRYNIIN